jgi:hypothetical protein
MIRCRVFCGAVSDLASVAGTVQRQSKDCVICCCVCDMRYRANETKHLIAMQRLPAP